MKWDCTKDGHYWIFDKYEEIYCFYCEEYLHDLYGKENNTLDNILFNFYMWEIRHRKYLEDLKLSREQIVQEWLKLNKIKSDSHPDK